MILRSTEGLWRLISFAIVSPLNLARKSLLTETVPKSIPGTEMTSSVHDDGPQPKIFARTILEKRVRWASTDRIGSLLDFERIIKLNSCMSFVRNQKPIGHTLIFSQGNEYVASVIADASANDIEVIVYRTHLDSMDQVWNSHIAIPRSPYEHTYRESMTLRGYVSSDGERVLVEFNQSYGDAQYQVTSNRGAKWVPFKPMRPNYYSQGDVSASGEHIFFTRSADPFGAGGQAETVDVYSTRTWAHVKSCSFGFGDGSQLQNLYLLRRLAIDKPVFCVISTNSSSSHDTHGCIIASSTGLQFHAEMEYSYAGEGALISDDDRHMIYLTRDDGVMSYWDLTKPTLKPLKSIQLPDIQIAQKYIHVINGQETVVRHSIPKQISCCRFSPDGEVITIAVADDSRVVVSSFLTFNLQIVFKKVLDYSLWPGFVVLKISIGEERGVSVMGAVAEEGNEQMVHGLVVTFGNIPRAYEHIRALEDYFDHASTRLNLYKSVKGGHIYRWKVSINGVARESGRASAMTNVEKK
jgi:hypothetical protein